MGTGVTPKRIATGNLCCLFAQSFVPSPQPTYVACYSVTLSYEFCWLSAISSKLDCIHSSKFLRSLWQLDSNATPYFIPSLFLRKEVIQPQVLLRLPCYDFTPVIRPAFDGSLLTVKSPASGISDSHGVTGGVYKTRERIHRSMLICDY